MPYGWHYFQSCFKYKTMRSALAELQSRAFEADEVLLNLTGGQSLVRSSGSLGLFADADSIALARTGEMRERQEQGVRLEFLDASKVHDLEPHLAPFYAGGVYYPDTRFTISPVELSRCYARYFQAQGGRFIHDKVNFIEANDQGVRIQCSLHREQYDQLVIAAGVASKPLVAQLGLNIPLVSERGYHLMIGSEGKQLGRPVAWLDKSVFISPMEEGIRMAGTAEFADENAAPNHGRIDCMKRHAPYHARDRPSFRVDLGRRPSVHTRLPAGYRTHARAAQGYSGLWPRTPRPDPQRGHGQTGCRNHSGHKTFRGPERIFSGSLHPENVNILRMPAAESAQFESSEADEIQSFF